MFQLQEQKNNNWKLEKKKTKPKPTPSYSDFSWILMLKLLQMLIWYQQPMIKKTMKHLKHMN